MHYNTIHKKLLSTVLVLLSLIFAGSVNAADEAQSASTLSHITPALLEGQLVYPSSHVNIVFEPLQAYEWREIRLPEEWASGEYYVELWDHENHVVPGFGAHRFNKPTIDLSSIDATLYPKIRLLLFQPELSPPLPYNEPIYFIYDSYFNTRLVVFAGIIAAMILMTLILVRHYNIRATELIRFRALRNPPLSEPLLKTVARYSAMIFLWSSVFAIALGSFIGLQQVVYLLVKLPFLLLGAFAFTVSTNAVFTALLGLNVSTKEIVQRSLATITSTAVALSALAPPLLFFIWQPQLHDQLLVSTVGLFGAAALVGAFQFYAWMKTLHLPFPPILVVGMWVAVYGVVLLQLAWLLRPWVGEINPVTGSVPFSRLYGGNVFIQLLNTINRL